MFRASLCPSSGVQDVCYCMWCAALVLLDVVGSGCGALRFGVRALCRLLFDSLHNLLTMHGHRNLKQYSAVACSASNRAWLKGSDAGTVQTVNSNSRTANCQCRLFSNKNPIIIFSACSDGWPSQLIRMSGVQLCLGKGMQSNTT